MVPSFEPLLKDESVNPLVIGDGSTVPASAYSGGMFDKYWYGGRKPRKTKYAVALSYLHRPKPVCAGRKKICYSKYYPFKLGRNTKCKVTGNKFRRSQRIAASKGEADPNYWLQILSMNGRA